MPKKLPIEKRPPMGAHLTRLREAAGFSQAQLAELVGVNQQTIAYWEGSDKPPRSDVVLRLAEVLEVEPVALLSPEPAPKKKPGPVSRARRAFEQVSQLPRRKRERILEVIDALLEHYDSEGDAPAA